MLQIVLHYESYVSNINIFGNLSFFIPLLFSFFLFLCFKVLQLTIIYIHVLFIYMHALAEPVKPDNVPKENIMKGDCKSRVTCFLLREVGVLDQYMFE